MKKIALLTASMLLSLILILPSCTKDEEKEEVVPTGICVNLSCLCF